MLQFLETGKALYVLAAVCVLGMLGKLITRNLYRRLIKESGNMVMTKNKNLKLLRQRVESSYRTNSGINDLSVYLDRQTYDFKFMGMTLSGWGNFTNQLTMMSFLLGGGLAFLSYWYRCDNYYIVLYGTMGILSGLLTMIVESGVNLTEKRQQLLVAMQDYLENSLFIRPGKERMVIQEEEVPETARSGSRETARTAERAVQSTKRPLRGRKAEAARIGKDQDSEPTGRRDVDYLKRSLEQIAASREKTRADENWLQDLEPEEVKLIGDILKEYLS